MSLPRERELKLSVSPSFRMPAFDALGQEVEAIAHEPERYMATYYDTEDLRRARSRITLRYRTNDDWTLKLPAENGSGFLLRTELRFEGSPRRLPDSLEDLVRAYTRGAVLRPAEDCGRCGKLSTSAMRTGRSSPKSWTTRYPSSRVAGSLRAFEKSRSKSRRTHPRGS